jgi:hypothetical protein
MEKPVTQTYVMPEDFAWEAPAPLGRDPFDPDPTLCVHCQLEPKSERHRGTHLGAWCLRAQRKNGGTLPTDEQIERRQLKLYRDQQEDDGHDPATRYEAVTEVLVDPAVLAFLVDEPPRPRRTGPLIPDTEDGQR